MGTWMLELQYSRGAALAVAAAALATAGLAFALPLEAEWRAAGVAWSGVAGVRALRRLGRVRRLSLDEEGGMRTWSAAGEERGGRLAARSFVAPWLVLLQWLPNGERFEETLLIVPSMAPAQALRRLRVRLRWAAPVKPPPAAAVERVPSAPGPRP